ncbi:MAG: HAD family hydrolase [Lachnospiraceae bacterium]|nr:HAD family hydrolase [Lachnospiraceae bacterium]
MNLTTVLFDLDGTLLPMDNDAFTKGYFKLLAAKLAPHGYDAKQLVDAIWAGTASMVKNDGSQSNEAAFWEKFADIFGEKALADKSLFDEFYEKEFQTAKALCGFNPKAAIAVHTIKEMGFRVALATNPIFPAVATQSRIRWAGLEPEDFELYTTYENIGYCKPNPEYYREIAKRLGVQPEECLMVGNDVTEDMIAETVGMKVFLLSNCLLNKERKDINKYPRGSFEQLFQFIEKERMECL